MCKMPVTITIQYKNRKEVYYDLKMEKIGKTFRVYCKKEIRHVDIPAFLSKRMGVEEYDFIKEGNLHQAIEVYERVDRYMHNSLKIEVEEE